jgi:hypothetical protein
MSSKDSSLQMLYHAANCLSFILGLSIEQIFHLSNMPASPSKLQ